METEIIRQKDLVLSWLNTSEGVKIIARVIKNGAENIYEGLLPVADHQETLFENPQEIVDYMKMRDNIEVQIDSDLITIKVLSRLNTKKTKFIEIFRISLILVKMEMIEMISYIIRECNVEGELSKDILKKSIKTLAEGLQKLLVQKETNQTAFNYSVPQLSTNILQQFQLFKEEVHDLIHQYKQVNQTKCNYEQSLRISLKNMQQKTMKFEQKFNQQCFKIYESITSFGKRISDQLDFKMKKVLSKYVTSKQIQIMKKRLKCLQLQNLMKYRKEDDIQISPNSSTSENMMQLKIEDQINFQNLFKETENRVQYIGQDNKASHYIFKQKIPQDKPYRFKIKILQLTSPQIYVGVFDQHQQKQKRTFSLNKSWCYGACGQRYQPKKHKKQQSSGFGQGDIVEVIVDIPEHTIKWLVNGVNHVQYFFINTQTSLMPFIMVWKTNTQVEWINDD